MTVHQVERFDGKSLKVTYSETAPIRCYIDGKEVTISEFEKLEGMSINIWLAESELDM